MLKRFCLILSFAIGIVLLAVLPALAESVDTAWVRGYDGSGNGFDSTWSMTVSNSGNVYVTGWSDGGSGKAYDYATIKYRPNGDTAWVRRYHNNHDVATAIAVDLSGYVYVAGHSYGLGTSSDYATIKYTPDGDTAWVRRYDGPSNSYDGVMDIAVDGSDNVYVTGQSRTSGSYNDDYATIKYYPNGDTAWVRRYAGPANGGDYAIALAVDGSGNVYVAGFTDCDSSGSLCDYATIKYYPNGDTAWVRRYNGAGDSTDWVTAMALDGSSNVYVTGFSYGAGTDFDYATVKYDSMGNELWVETYNGTGDSTDRTTAIAVDNSGNVYVTGYSYVSGTGYDYATVKYYPNGDTAWVRTYNGTGDSTDRANAISVDGSGNVYVTGYSYSTGTDYDYVTIKYDSVSNERWVKAFNGLGSSMDGASAIAIDGSNSVYVAGGSWGVGTDWDYTTIKYVQAFSHVSIIDFAFVPQADTITVGDSVRWTNNGAETHTSTSDAKSLWDSGTLNPGESFTFQFNDLGSYPYHCEFHPSMVGTIVVTSTDVKDETGDRERPSEFTLSQNYPNPFNQNTKIEFTLAKPGFVSLNIYDILGRKVRTLVSEHLFAGYKSVLWDGKNDAGEDVASGIYFYQIKVEGPASGGADNFGQTKKLTLLK